MKIKVFLSFIMILVLFKAYAQEKTQGGIGIIKRKK